MKKIFSILIVLFSAFFNVACTNEEPEMSTAGNGFLRVQVETVVSTITRAVNDVPNDYAPKTLHVEILDTYGNIVKDANGNLLSTDNFATDSKFQGNIALTPGTYTVVAHSAKWDGSNSAFDAPYYAGQTTVNIKKNEVNTASITCKLANVKVTVNFDSNFKKYFQSAVSEVSSSIVGVAKRSFVMNQASAPAYFPVGDLAFKVMVNGDSEKTQTDLVTDVKARDHYIVNYSVGDPTPQNPTGNQGTVRVFIDEATQTYTYNITVPRKNETEVTASDVSPWSNFVELSGSAKLEKNDYQNVTMQWKPANASEWNTINNSDINKGDGKYAYKLKGLSPNTDYIYRLVYDGVAGTVNSNEVNFTTESQLEVYNGGFENWYQSSGNNAWYPNERGVSFWDSSNPGSASMNRNVTTQETSIVHSGSSSAKLASTWIVIKFAAASIYTGEFDHLVGTNGAVIQWGRPFTARPSNLTGWMRYTAGSINRGTQPAGAPAKNSPDECQIFCALLSESIEIDNTRISETFPKWDGSDARIIAYGAYSQNTTDDDWKQFNIPLTYYSTTRKPTHVLIVCSSSKYGDYFYGSDSSVLYLDDFSFTYGEPTVQ